MNTDENKNKYIKELLNGTFSAIKQVIPVQHNLMSPKLLNQTLQLEFGVLIGITGDLKGKLILKAEPEIFGSIGQSMFGMPLEGEMLASFSGELGNMIAGSLSTIIVEKGINTDITAPTVLQGDTKLLGFEKAIQLTVTFESIGEMEIYLLIDQV